MGCQGTLEHHGFDRPKWKRQAVKKDVKTDIVYASTRPEDEPMGLDVGDVCFALSVEPGGHAFADSAVFGSFVLVVLIKAVAELIADTDIKTEGCGACLGNQNQVRNQVFSWTVVDSRLLVELPV